MFNRNIVAPCWAPKIQSRVGRPTWAKRKLKINTYHHQHEGHQSTSSDFQINTGRPQIYQFMF